MVNFAVYAAMAMARAGAMDVPRPVAAAERKVTICGDERPDLAFGVARRQVTWMYAKIGVTLVWHDTKRCPDGALRISLFNGDPAEYRPEMLGYAMPYEGTRIVVFWERIEAMAPNREATQLLAHVIAHEIAHVLQGTSRHSASGLMKAHWDRTDIRNLYWKPMPFTEEDVDLIYLGVQQRGSKVFASRN